MKSSLFNMVTVLLCITAVTSAAVGAVYYVTAEPIEIAKGQKKASALAQVLPPFDNAPAQQVDTVAVDGGQALVYTATMAGEPVGYAVESAAAGFAGDIRLMVGFDTQGAIRNIRVLEQGETPGLGAKVAEEDNPVEVSFVGKSPADLKMAVRKDGGDIDAITASTISSRAYVQAVSRAYAAYLEVSGGAAEEWDTSSGATHHAAEADAENDKGDSL